MSRTLRQLQAELRSLRIPSARDRALFLYVVAGKHCQSVLARHFGVTQGRVSQIAARVRTWLQSATPEQDRSLPEADQLRQAVFVVRQKMNFLLADAWHAWRASIGDRVTVKTRHLLRGDVIETTTKRHFGDTTYLAQCRDVSIALAKLDGVEFVPLERRRNGCLAVPLTERSSAKSELIISADAAAEVAKKALAAERATNEATDTCTFGGGCSPDGANRERADEKANNKGSPRAIHGCRELRRDVTTARARGGPHFSGQPRLGEYFPSTGPNEIKSAVFSGLSCYNQRRLMGKLHKQRTRGPPTPDSNRCARWQWKTRHLRPEYRIRIPNRAVCHRLHARGPRRARPPRFPARRRQPGNPLRKGLLSL